MDTIRAGCDTQADPQVNRKDRSMLSISSLYDRPGAHLVDHPGSAKAIRKTIATLAIGATIALAAALPAAAKNTNPINKTPGGVGQYSAPAVGSSLRGVML